MYSSNSMHRTSLKIVTYLIKSAAVWGIIRLFWAAVLGFEKPSRFDLHNRARFLQFVGNRETVLGSKTVLGLTCALYSPRNDPDPEMIPKSTPK